MPKFATYLLMGLFWPTLVLAEDSLKLDKELQELLKLDLEELTTVSVASKKEENVDSAPGIITVITAEEIKRYGARNLRDILDRQTSMQIMGSNLLPHNRTSIRGAASTHIDTNVLILINGRPIRESLLSSVNFDLYNYFPISSLKQIEIIRGPGSVLYGTNAFSGVINLVIKDAPETPTANMSLTYGSYDHKQGQLSGGGKWGDLEIFGSIRGVDTAGDNRNNIVDEFGTTGTYKTGREGEQLIVNAKYRGFTLNALQSSTSTDNARSVFALPSTTYEYDRQFIDLGYQHHFSDTWTASANVSYQRDESFLFLNAVPNTAEQSGENYLFELNTSFSPLAKMNVLTGGIFRSISNKGSPSFDTTSSSLYSQIDYQVFDWLKLIGGLQYNKPKDISGDLSPRLAAIAHFNKHWGTKFLYGKAFREAPAFERFVNAPSIVGNPSLKPETIETTDLQLFYKSKTLFFSATYFHSEQNNLITRVSGTPLTIINSGKITYDGFELEGKWQVNPQWELIGNMSYQTNEKNDGTENVTYSPDWMIKTGASYNSRKGYELSLFNSYFAASTLQNHQITTVTQSNSDADGYNLLTANLSMNLGQTLNNKNLSNINLSLYGDNLLDEDIFFPSINRTSVNSIPHHYGRGFYGTINIEF